MAGTRKLDVLTITQARKAFQRAKFILEQRQKALSEAESSADAAQLAKVTQAEIVLKSRDFLRNFLKITREFGYNLGPGANGSATRIADYSITTATFL